MNKAKKFMLGAAAFAAPALCFAEGETTSALDTALTSLQTGVTGAIDKIAPVVAAVVVAGIVLWAIPLAWRKIRGGVGR